MMRTEHEGVLFVKIPNTNVDEHVLGISKFVRSLSEFCPNFSKKDCPVFGLGVTDDLKG